MRRIFLSAFFALLVLLGASTQVLAAQTSVLLPLTAGAYQQWTPKSGSNHVTMVDESSCNGTTDFNHETTVGGRESYGVSVASIPDGATITQIAITPCASRNNTGTGTSTLDVFYRLNGIDSADGGAYAVPTGVTPAVLSSTSFASLSAVKSSTTTLEIGAQYNAGNKGLRLSQITTQVTYTPLATPSGLSASATGANVTLNWIDNSSNENGFKIERSDNGGAFNQIATVSANITTYPDSGLSAGTYAYRVRAYNSGGNSGYTSTATAHVVNAPSSLVATATGSAVALAWTDNSSNEDGFKIEIATGAGAFVLYKTVGANVATSSATNLSPNTYSFRVRAYKSSSNSDYSNTDTATVLSAPSGLTAVATGTMVDLNWIDNSSNEDGFKIEIATGGGPFVEIADVPADSTTYSDGFESPDAYTYRVRAYKSADTSNYSNTAATTVLDMPYNLQASVLGADVTLTWTDSASAEAGFRIERADNGGSYAEIGTVGADVTTFSDLGLASGTYDYRVRAYNGVNHSFYANPAQAILP